MSAVSSILCDEPEPTNDTTDTCRVIAYTLLCGYSPFRSDDKGELIKETTKGKIQFHERYWKKVSETGKLVVSFSCAAKKYVADRSARDFIKAMLQVDPKKRLTAEEALQHPVSCCIPSCLIGGFSKLTK